MLKQIAALTVFAGIAIGGATDSHAQATIGHVGGGTTGGGTILANACASARAQAIAWGRTYAFASADCATQTRQGYVHISFNGDGVPYRVWTYDSHNVGHYFSASTSLTHGVRINNKNYHGPRMETIVDAYTTDAPSRYAFTGGGAASGSVGGTFTMDGRVWYKRSTVRVEMDTELGEVHQILSLYDAKNAYEDRCLIWTKSAESTAPGVTPTALVVHMNWDGTKNEKYRWDGSPVDFTRFSCSSFLPTNLTWPAPNPALFDDVMTNYGATFAGVQKAVAQSYSAHGADPSNALSIFPIAHAQRMSFGLHPLKGPKNTGWLGDGWSQHAQGIIDGSLVVGGVGGLVGITGGPVGMLLGFAGGFIGTYAFAVIYDIDNGIDPRTGEKPGAELELPELRDDELLSDEEVFLLADWDGNANDPYNDDGSPEASGGANDGMGSYEGGADGGDSCSVNANSCFPAARKKGP